MGGEAFTKVSAFTMWVNSLKNYGKKMQSQWNISKGLNILNIQQDSLW